MRSNRITDVMYWLLGAAIFCLLAGGCVKDDRKDCYEPLTISFFSQTPCQDYPIWPDNIDDITLLVFDSRDLLYYTSTTYDIGELRNFTETVDLEAGVYTIAAWSGLDEEYMNIIDLRVGVTEKDDLLFRVRQYEGQIILPADASIYFGGNNAVDVDESPVGRAVGGTVAVNMQEITNHITVTVNGLGTESDDYRVRVLSDNGSMQADGRIVTDGEDIYAPYDLTYTTDRIRSRFTLMKLDDICFFNMTVYNSVSGEVVYSGDLLHDIILKMPGVNLDCDHDFDVDINVDGNTNIITEIYINGWLVHSYGTEM